MSGINSIEAHMNTAQIAFEQENFSVVLETCGIVLAQQPDHHDALTLRGRACQQMKDAAGALESWVLLDDSTSPQLYRRLRIIRTLIALKRYREAKLISVATQEQWPDDPQLLWQIIRICDLLGEWREVSNTWISIKSVELQILPEFIESSFYLAACGKAARAYYQQKAYPEAVEICNMMLEREADNRVALNIKIDTHRQLRQRDQVLGVLRTRCQYYPTTYSYWQQYIASLCAVGRREEAEYALQEAKLNLAHEAMACARLALIAESQMMNVPAQGLLVDTLSLAPDDIDVLECLIEGYWKLNRVEMAVHFGNKLKAICPEAHRANATLEDIHTLLALANVKVNPEEGRCYPRQKVSRTELVAKLIVETPGPVQQTRNQEIHKVAMISSSMMRGGAERQVAACLKSLSKDPKRDFDVWLYCLSHQVDPAVPTYYRDIHDLPITLKEFKAEPNWDILDHPRSDQLEPWVELLRFLPPYDRKIVARLFYHFMEQKPDIVHSWQDGINIPASLAALMAGVPRTLLSACTLAPQQGSNELKLMPYNLHADIWQASYRYLLKNPGIRLCHNSSAGAETYRRWLDEPTLKMPILFNGVDFDGIAKASEGDPDEEAVSQIERLKHGFVIGTVIRFEPVKRPFLWIEAAQIILSSHPECVFLMVGSGSMLEDCKLRVSTLGMSDAFVFTGFTSRVKAWLDLMDIFLMTSYVEGLPNALIEAQGFGVPAVTTDAGGAKEVIIDGITGRVAAGDANAVASVVVSCLRDQPWLQAASSAATSHSTQKFSIANMHTRLKTLYAFQGET